MNVLVEVTIPLEPFNSLVRRGEVGEALSHVLEVTAPKAAYFTTQGNGQRGGVLVYEIEDSSELPKLAEPWFLTFNAEVLAKPCMTPEDLARANLDEVGKTWSWL